MESAEDVHVKVVARFRPVNEREHDRGGGDRCTITCSDNRMLEIGFGENDLPKRYTFDKIFFEDSSQDDVYDAVGRVTVNDVKQGYNGTIFAYGQTGSGKSHTMFGPDMNNPQVYGIIPRACGEIFKHIEDRKEHGEEHRIAVSFLEIYCEKVKDLINVGNDNLRVMEAVRADGTRNTVVRDLTEIQVDSVEKILAILTRGEAARACASTAMNAQSSRSHSVFILKLIKLRPKQQKSAEEDGGVECVSKLCLVDLAGSEKLSKSEATGQSAEEARKINQSLSTLGRCIAAIGENVKLREVHLRRVGELQKKKRSGKIPPFKPVPVPFRDSQLTRILADSLVGNTITHLCICVSPAQYNLDETVSTLNFGRRVKAIKNEVRTNRSYTKEQLEAMLAVATNQLAVYKTERISLFKELNWYRENVDVKPPASVLSNVDDALEVPGGGVEALAQTEKELLRILKLWEDGQCQLDMDSLAPRAAAHVADVATGISTLRAALRGEAQPGSGYRGDREALKLSLETNLRIEATIEQLTGTCDELLAALCEKEAEVDRLKGPQGFSDADDATRTASVRATAEAMGDVDARDVEIRLLRAELDAAIAARDSALQERDQAVLERDNALETVKKRDVEISELTSEVTNSLAGSLAGSRPARRGRRERRPRETD